MAWSGVPEAHTSCQMSPKAERGRVEHSCRWIHTEEWPQRAGSPRMHCSLLICVHRSQCVTILGDLLFLAVFSLMGEGKGDHDLFYPLRLRCDLL